MIPPITRLEAFIVSLKCSVRVSAFIFRSNPLKVAALESSVCNAACCAALLLIADTLLPAVSFTKPEPKLRNVVAVLIARSPAAVKLLTSVFNSLNVICNPSADTTPGPPVRGTDEPVAPSWLACTVALLASKLFTSTGSSKFKIIVLLFRFSTNELSIGAVPSAV